MNTFYLTEYQVEELTLAHRETKSKREADCIKAILSLGKGWSIVEIANFLLRDAETIRNYKDDYISGGIEQLVSTNYKGSESKLTLSELQLLEAELEDKIYLTTKEIIDFVNKTFDVSYTESGMRDLLHRMGYEYKKPKLVPGKTDIHAQELFAEQYKAFMECKPDDTEVLFVDAVHPQHNTIAAYGWIKLGQTRTIETNSGRERLNLHGAINAETYQVTIIESETVNAQSSIDLFDQIEQAYPLAKEIILILDNASYHFSKSVREYVEQSRIKLNNLPSYSPNLNLIERLWHFFKKSVLYNQYYKTIKDFRKACIKFFRNIDQHHEAIHRFMSADFELN